MTHAVEAIRHLGMIVTAFGAWFHSVAAILLGVAVTILAWTWGLLPARRAIDRLTTKAWNSPSRGRAGRCRAACGICYKGARLRGFA